MRSLQRLLNKPIPDEMKEAQLNRLKDLMRQAELHKLAEQERKLAVRYRKVKFFERRKIDRRIAKLEKWLQKATEDPSCVEEGKISEIEQELANLKEDLEYVKFFPKTEKYVSLFKGDDDEEIIAKRKALREQIKLNIAAAAARGEELEETVSDADDDEEEEEGASLAMESIEDDFFLSGDTNDDTVGETEANVDWSITKFKPSGSKIGTNEEPSDPKRKNRLPGFNVKHNHGKSNFDSQKQKPLRRDNNNEFKKVNKSKQSHVTRNVASQKQRPLHKDHNDKFKMNKDGRYPIRLLSKTGGQFPANQNGGQLSASKKASIFSPSRNNTGKLQNQSIPSSSTNINKAVETPTLDFTNNEGQQKRKRKRRPKKKK